MKKREYIDSVHFYGRIWCILALVVFLMVPTAMCLHFGVWPEAGIVLKGLGSVAILFYPTAVIEVVSYAPLLGAGGTYLSFITGNITNLKMPCALNAMENAKVRANSEEGEVISTIAIATSAIVTTIVIAVFVVIFAFIPSFKDLVSQENSAWSMTFKQVTLTIFGSLAATYFVKHWKIAIFPIAAVSIVLIFAGTLPVGTLIFVGVALSLIGAQVMYKLKIVGHDDEKKEAGTADAK
ncbi:MAG: hypothetical protein MR567_04670 [Oscillospiraceae bacterium]|nr:hypothetical protein [Oscillospiraceae bacterium]